eukprot:CAMPEP_0172940950 /NCGR_PEP_ID=MMETSP1075-20121228/224296_1 /TAXON_ID=2916 /ORGANISM="Ceratium fusus, Strain PA161109" /LENGTH=244 /DNA_ID=CAMNT_0013802359 /DNA_START=168 /DNA_END=900 /DNA_ORIENTATION=+
MALHDMIGKSQQRLEANDITTLKSCPPRFVPKKMVVKAAVSAVCHQGGRLNDAMPPNGDSTWHVRFQETIANERLRARAAMPSVQWVVQMRSERRAGFANATSTSPAMVPAVEPPKCDLKGEQVLQTQHPQARQWCLRVKQVNFVEQISQASESGLHSKLPIPSAGAINEPSGAPSGLSCASSFCASFGAMLDTSEDRLFTARASQLPSCPEGSAQSGALEQPSIPRKDWLFVAADATCLLLVL